MKPLLDKTTSKNDKIVRLYKPPTLEEMEATRVKYFSFSSRCSTNIMRHLGHCFLHLLISVNKSFYNLLNGPFIFAYCNNKMMIDSELLKGLYERHEVFLNEHKATCHKGNIPPRSMIMCSKEWPDIDPRKLHLLSLVDPHTCKILAFQTFWCGNMTGFYHILSDHSLLPDDPSFQQLTFDTNRTSYRVLKWREPTSKNVFSHILHSCFDFSLKRDGYLQAAVEYLERPHLFINVSLEFLCSNPPTDLFLENNTLRLRVDQFSVILTIDKCERLIYL
jgi:hypothetical protein